MHHNGRGRWPKPTALFLKRVINHNSGVRIFNWHFPIVPVRLLGSCCLLFPGVGLISGGMVLCLTGHDATPRNTERVKHCIKVEPLHFLIGG
jgi:hypothetical protein